MAKLSLSKSGLRKQCEDMRLYEPVLPSLDLKRMQLSAELKRARQQLAEAEAEVEKLNKRIAEELPMLANREIEISGLVQVAAERVRLLEEAERRITQRVNLFDKILIPTAKKNIQKIQIYLADVGRAAVVRSKLTKRMRQRLAAEE
ncbi:MAG: hypothetical protein GY850_09905 [bacterium]|nr:hypothetical protein [bacterium]